MYAPEKNGKRVGGHVTGSILPFAQCYAKDGNAVDEVIKMIREKKLTTKTMRCIYLRVSGIVFVQVIAAFASNP
jgi:hypothetical protein